MGQSQSNKLCALCAFLTRFAVAFLVLSGRKSLAFQKKSVNAQWNPGKEDDLFRLKRFFAMVALFLQVSVSPILAQQVGIQWEFNEAGNAEGWSAYHSLSNLTVSGGILSATVTGDYPQLAGPAFDLPASDFGFVVIRMKAIGATDAVIQWKPDSLLWGFQRFKVEGDSTFHVYRVPVYQSVAWRGRIQGITRLTVTAATDTRLEIDYIRIVHLGAFPEIRAFKPLRTVWKAGHPVPLVAVVGNFGDEPASSVRVKLVAPAGFTILEGNDSLDLGLMPVNAVDTLSWTVSCAEEGQYTMGLELISGNSDTVAASIPAPVTNTYWRQKEFFLSAWSPPCAWDPPPLQASHFDYYHQANFDLVLWVVPTTEGVEMTRRFGMSCLLNVTWLVGGDPYLREADPQPPELTPELLSHLDPVVDQFRSDSTVKGYFVVDEPHLQNFQNLGKVVGYLRNKDPERLSFINLYPGEANQPAHGAESYNAYIEQFLDVVKPEMLSYDRYIFFKDHDGGSYFSNLTTIRKWALRYSVPFCNIIQAIGTDCCGLNWRTPTEAEHRWLVYTSLAYGAKGLIWFHWDGSWGVTGSPDRDQIFSSIKQLNAEIKSIGPEMLKLTSLRVYHTQGKGINVLPPDDPMIRSVSPGADLVLGVFENDAGNPFLMVMNKNYKQDTTATLTLQYPVDSLKVFNVFSGKWETVRHENTTEGAQFEVSLRAGGGKLFAIGSEGTAGVSSPPAYPQRWALLQNYPNPFNSQTKIPFQLSKKEHISLAIYNLRGQRLATLVDAELTPGRHLVRWSGKSDRTGKPVPSGVYFARLMVNGRVQTRKLLYLP